MAFVVVFGVVAAAWITLLFLGGTTPSIDRRAHPRAIARLEEIPVNETMQWILVRSHDVRNPVALFVHGGPGTSQLAWMRHDTRDLEKCFTVVNWDQRRAGKSFDAGKDRSHMHVEQFVDDLIAVASHLAKRFRQEKIVLVGHSWGSAIGMLAVAKRPDLFSTYVGIGQMSNLAESERRSYAWTLEQAKKAGDRKSEDALARIGPPPYEGDAKASKMVTQRKILARYGGEVHASRIGAAGIVLKSVLFGREYTMRDRLNVFRGIAASLDALLPEMYGIDLFTQAAEVKVPVTFCLGRHDREVPCSLAVTYFDALKAPQKKLVWFERSAHLPSSEEREKFQRLMIDEILPSLRRPSRRPDVATGVRRPATIG